MSNLLGGEQSMLEKLMAAQERIAELEAITKIECGLHDCYVEPRQDDEGPLFYQPANSTLVLANLRDYAIVPRAKYHELEAALETERMRLAGCSVAALGYYKEGDGIKEEYKSASLADVCRLYQEVTRLRVDAAIGAVVWKYIARMNDVVPSDPAERILCEFCHAVQPVMDAAKESADDIANKL